MRKRLDRVDLYNARDLYFMANLVVLDLSESAFRRVTDKVPRGTITSAHNTGIRQLNSALSSQITDALHGCSVVICGKAICGAGGHGSFDIVPASSSSRPSLCPLLTQSLRRL